MNTRPLRKTSLLASIDAGIRTKISAHSFRATGTTEYLKNGGTLEKAQAIADHDVAREIPLMALRKTEQVGVPYCV